MKRNARVVAEMPGRQGKVNSANTIGHAVRVFVICEATMISVSPFVRKSVDKGYMEKKTEEPIATSWFEDELFVIEELFLYLLVTSEDITLDRIFAEYHRIIQFCSEVTSYQNVFSLRPRSSSAITKKLQEIKGKLKVDEELFKNKIQYNCFFD